jgi:hypothetical protein
LVYIDAFEATVSIALLNRTLISPAEYVPDAFYKIPRLGET